MTTHIEDLWRLAEDIGGELCEQYSGREMFGGTCVGIITHNPDSVIEEAAALGIRGAKTDSMGLATIVYWPEITVKKEVKP